jgi:hypothetical protein
MLVRQFGLVLFLLSGFYLFSQNNELGKVSKDELLAKSHQLNEDAEAAFLVNKFNYNIKSGFKTYTIKLKIYKKTGLEWANFDLFNSSKGETLKIISAYTYNIENGNIIKTKIRNENIFETDLNYNVTKTTVTFPDVKIGSIVELEYTIFANGISFFFEWYFEKKIPVDYSEIKVQIPTEIRFSYYFKGFLAPKVIDDSYEKKIFLANVPAYKEEPFVNNINNYLTAVRFDLAQTNFRNSFTDSFSTDWATVAGNIYKFPSFGEELNHKDYFVAELDQILIDKNSRDDRIKAVFEFVKSKVKWNEKISFLCEEGVKTAFKKKLGNAAELNLMLTAMLRYADIDASPVLISTQSNGLIRRPSLFAFNYVVCAVEIENEIIYLDATEEFTSPNILPNRALNWFGRIIRKNGFSTQVDMFPKIISTANYNLMLNINSDGKISGKYRKISDNYVAFNERKNLNSKNKDNFIEQAEGRYKDIEITDYQLDNLKDTYLPLVENFNFSKEDAVEIINDKIYFSPMFFLKYQENLFKAEKREYPIDFNYPYENKYNLIIQIPEGYEVESLPEQIKIMVDSESAFSFFISSVGNTIQLKVIETQNTSLVTMELYTVFKEYFQKMVDKQNEKIVLKKI